MDPDGPSASPKRKQIIEGASKVFDQFGYDGASMSRIADEAGVSKGTLYNYFVSKSELFGAFVEEMIAGRFVSMLELDGTEDDVSAALLTIGRRLTETMTRPEALTMYRIVVSEANEFPHLASVFYDTVHARVRNDLAGWLTRQREAGRLSLDDPALAAEQFIALCRTRIWIRHCLNRTAHTEEAEMRMLLEATVRMFLNTYGVAS